ncbi:histidine kinase [Isoptericola halotolerans]|uniref:sensor histidine kinase n=1 Tax=Isoptericola halotolerans TaxID=300560 RepID=UPI00388F1A53
MSTKTPPAPSPRPRGLLRAWTGENLLADVLGAVAAFVLGIVLLGVGLVDLVSEVGPLGSVEPEPWWRVALLAVGCVVLLAKRTHPLLALGAGLVVVSVDLVWGGSLAILLVVLWELLFEAVLRTGRTARTWLWTAAATLTLAVAVAAGEASQELRYFVFAGLQMGAVVVMPMWWADNVRQKAELAELERARADEAARAAELERERAADLARIAALDRHEAVQAERAAMARDLHDVIASHLSSIAIHSGAALALPLDPQRDRTALEQVRESSVASLTEMRSMIELLRADVPQEPLVAPGRLDGLGELVRSARSAGDDVTVHDPQQVTERSVPAAVGQALHRIAQEALTNARKHAPGEPVTVAIDDGAGLTLRVSNPLPSLWVHDAPSDHAGQRCVVHPQRGEGPLSAGTGLITMRERAEGLGGTFTAGPTADGAWQVEAGLPVGEEVV